MSSRSTDFLTSLPPIDRSELASAPVLLQVVVDWPIAIDEQELLSALPAEFAGARVISAECESQCRVCGCTDTFGCNNRCWWVEPGLCSSCTGPAGEPAEVGQ